MSEIQRMTRAEFDEFNQKVRRHDWYYQFSDDKRAYAAGSASWSWIANVSKRFPEAKEALDLYRMYNDSTKTDEDRLVLNEETDKIRQELPE